MKPREITLDLSERGGDGYASLIGLEDALCDLAKRLNFGPVLTGKPTAEATALPFTRKEIADAMRRAADRVEHG